MTKEKQIEQMAKVIARRSKNFTNPNVAFMITATKTAESLYNAGYRKSSEIFEDIEQRLIFNNYGILTISKYDFAKLKKKYTEGSYGKQN